MHDYLASKKESAAFFRVSVQALDGWFTGGCPVYERDDLGRIKLVNLQDMAEWRIEKSSEIGSLESARVRLTLAQADLAEMDVRERLGEVVRMSVVAEYWQQMVAAMRAKLLALPTKAAAMVAPPDKLQATTDSIQGFVYEALAEIAGDAIPHEIRIRFAAHVRPTGPEGGKSTAETDVKPVGGGKTGTQSGRQRGAGSVPTE